MKNIVVIGGGTMGNGIAHAAAASGLEVSLVDVNDGILQRALATITANLQRGVDKGRMTADERDEVVGRIRTTTDMESIAGADIVIEAIIENLEAKTQLFAKLDAITRPDMHPGVEHLVDLDHQNRRRRRSAPTKSSGCTS